MKVDYDKLSHTYDSHRGGGGPYLETLVHLATECRARRVLEIGSGTGNNSAALLNVFPCDLIGLELSRGMLARAVDKQIRARWIRGSATDIPLASGTVDFVFACYVLHHLDSLDGVFAECARVLDAGAAAFVTAPTSFIERHPMNAYFPSFAKVDKARFQPIEAVQAALRKAGFRRVGAETFAATPRPVDREYVECVANRFISTYALLPDDEFREGLARLRADIEPTGRLDLDLIWEAVTVYGYLE